MMNDYVGLIGIVIMIGVFIIYIFQFSRLNAAQKSLATKFEMHEWNSDIHYNGTYLKDLENMVGNNIKMLERMGKDNNEIKKDIVKLLSIHPELDDVSVEIITREDELDDLRMELENIVKNEKVDFKEAVTPKPEYTYDFDTFSNKYMIKKGNRKIAPTTIIKILEEHDDEL